MKDDTYGIKLIQRFQPTATPQPTDLVSAKFSIGSFRHSYSQMTAEERNTMRERHWYRDPNIDTWVYCPPFLGIEPHHVESEPIAVDIAPSSEIARNIEDANV